MKVQHILAAAILAASCPAKAWNDPGHITVAEIAFSPLGEPAKTQIAALLELNPAYGAWIRDVAAGNQLEKVIVNAATWLDAIKSDSSYQNDGSSKDKAPGSGSVAIKGRSKYQLLGSPSAQVLAHLDMPFSPDGTALEHPVPPNVQTQTAAFRGALKGSTTSSATGSYDLVWLEHVFGEVHQPPYAMSGFTHDLPDAGGNDVALCASPCRDELHAFWDDATGTSSSVQAASSCGSEIAGGRESPPNNPNEKAWIVESLDAAKTDVYGAPIGIGKGLFTLTQAYKDGVRLPTTGSGLRGTA